MFGKLYMTSNEYVFCVYTWRFVVIVFKIAYYVCAKLMVACLEGRSIYCISNEVHIVTCHCSTDGTGVCAFMAEIVCVNDDMTCM